MVMVTHIKDNIYCDVGVLGGWGRTAYAPRSVGLDFWLRQLRKKRKLGTLRRYYNEFNLIDEKLCQWKDSS